MKRILRISFFSLLFVTTFISTYAQLPVRSMKQLKENLQTLQQKEGYQNDTSYINTVNQVAFLYADRFPIQHFICWLTYLNKVKQ